MINMSNNEENSNLKSIAMEFLFDGMIVAEDIFNHAGNLLLIAKDIELTDSKIAQLKNFNDFQRNISVYEHTYNALIEHGLTAANALAQEYLEENVGYTKIANSTSIMLENIRENDTVDKDETTAISDDVYDKLYSIDPSLIFQCINAPNPIDEYLRRHSVNVAMLNGLMGKWLKLSEEDISLLVLSGLVHDVGKSKIPPEILNVPRKLSICEFEVIKMHPLYSYELLSKDERFPECVKAAARSHHEKANGTGYPDRLIIDNIPLFAKITAVSDVYDAMISKRSYKNADNPFLVLANLARQQFSGLDMNLVNLFINHMPDELVGKPVLLSDGSIGIIKFIAPNDLEHPIVEVNNQIKKMNDTLYCTQMIFE